MTGFLAYVGELRGERRALGWRSFLRKRGWRLVLVVVAVYLVRDLVLFLVLPLAIASGLTR